MIDHKAISALVRTLMLVWVVASTTGAAPSILKLNDGSVIKGDVGPSSPTATEVVVSTEYGVIRVPVDKISPQSRTSAGIGQPATSTQYEARIAQLEAKVRQLELENASLRRSATATPTPQSQPSVTQPTSGTPGDGLSYSKSSTGKRHNSRCRYFTSGSACGPTVGVACKVCGG